jgi:hypothetical protein
MLDDTAPSSPDTTDVDERDRVDRLRASLVEAEEQTRRGQVVEWTPEVRDQIQREADAMTRQGSVPDPDIGV